MAGWRGAPPLILREPQHERPHIRGGERCGNEYGDGIRLGVRVSGFLPAETFA